jgi:hypothetical protein
LEEVFRVPLKAVGELTSADKRLAAQLEASKDFLELIEDAVLLVRVDLGVVTAENQ